MNIEACVCKYNDCHLIFDDPVTLSCGYSLCRNHLNESNQTFMCQFCSNEHSEFIPSKTISAIIEKYIELNPRRKKIRQCFDQLIELIQEYKILDQDEFIYDYFAEIKNKVDLYREELLDKTTINQNDKDEIMKISLEIIEKLEEKEQKCKSNAVNVEKTSLDKLIDVEKLLEWRKMLRNPNLSKSDLCDLLAEIYCNLNLLKMEASKFKKTLLMNESIKFNKSKSKNLFGSLKSTKNVLILSKRCGKIIQKFNNCSGRILSIKADEKTNRLICGSSDNSIKIWNQANKNCLKILEDHEDCVENILLISNNKFISGSNDRTIKIWDIDSYECLNTLENESGVRSLCLIPKNQIACGCHNGSISVWDLDNSIQVKTFEAHQKPIRNLKLTIDHLKLISCSRENMIKIWNLETFDCIQTISKGEFQGICNLDLTSNGNLLTSSSSDKTVKLWQIETGEILKSIQFQYEVFCLRTINENLIAVGLENGKIIIFDLNKMEIIKEISKRNLTDIYCLHILSNGNICCGDTAGRICLIDVFEN